MNHLLWPDWYFEDITYIPVGFFRENRIKYLICDIDNTLVSYADPLPTPPVLKFFEMLEQEEVQLAFASNNNKQRVNTFAEPTGRPAIYSAAKPLRRGVRAAMNAMNATLEECAMMGDQLLTDGLAAKNIGIRMILVNPIRDDKKNMFFRTKRRIERPVLLNYLKQHAINDPKPWKNVGKADADTRYKNEKSK